MQTRPKRCTHVYKDNHSHVNSMRTSAHILYKTVRKYVNAYRRRQYISIHTDVITRVITDVLLYVSVMAEKAMAYIVMACMGMAYMVIAYIVLAFTFVAYVVMAYIGMVTPLDPGTPRILVHSGRRSQHSSGTGTYVWTC